METPQNILEELMCVQCGSQLRRGPVFQREDGSAACGPCQELKGAPLASRNRAYEVAARALRFPCRYREEGCAATMTFIPAGTDEPEHEAACEFQMYTCPVLGRESCDWVGRRAALQQHCITQHADRFLPNPALLMPDLRRTRCSNYLIHTHQHLFLLLTRVCVVSANLYYSMRLLSEPRTPLLRYVFSVTVHRGQNTISRTQPVLPLERQLLNENSALTWSVNSLFNMLGGWDGATLSVEVKQDQAEAEPRHVGAEPRLLEAELEVCGGCGARTVRLYRDEDRGWLCEHCAPARELCLNEGCDFQDFPRKVERHGLLWCERRSECKLCGLALQPDTPARHYPTCTELRVLPTGAGHRVPRSLVGTWLLVEDVLCWCEYTNGRFWLGVIAPVAGRELPRYRCEVQLKCASHTCTYTPSPLYQGRFDWEVDCQDRRFLTDDIVNVHVNVTLI